MDLSKINFCTCKYRIEQFDIKIPGYGIYKVDPEYVQGIILEKEFDTHMFPYFEITIQVPNKILRYMRKNFGTCTCNILMKYAMIQDSNMGANTKQQEFWNIYFNKQFSIYMDKGSPDLNESKIERYERDKGINDETMTTNDFAIVQMALYNEYLEKSKKVVNAVLTGVTLTDVMVYTLNTAGIKNVLMTPANNNSVPNPYIIHPVTVMQQLGYLADRFNMHSRGTIIFFDLTRAYIIDKNPKCTAWGVNEIKKTHLISKTDDTNTGSSVEGCYKDSRSKENIISILPSNLEVQNASYINDQLKGNNVKVIGQDGSISEVSTNAKTNSGNVTFMYDTKSGGTANSVLKNELEEANAVATIGLRGVALDMLDPNLEYNLNVNNSKYNGSYRITSQKTTFMKDGKNLIPNTVIQLKGNKG